MPSISCVSSDETYSWLCSHKKGTTGHQSGSSEFSVLSPSSTLRTISILPLNGMTSNDDILTVQRQYLWTVVERTSSRGKKCWFCHFYFIRNENHKLKRPALEGFAPSFLNNMIKNRNATSLSLSFVTAITRIKISLLLSSVLVLHSFSLSHCRICFLMVLFKMKCSLYLPRNYVFPFASNKTWFN